MLYLKSYDLGKYKSTSVLDFVYLYMVMLSELMELILNLILRFFTRPAAIGTLCARVLTGLESAVSVVGRVVVVIAGLTFPSMAGADRLALNPPPLPLGPELSRFDPARFFEDREDLTKALYDVRSELVSPVRPTQKEIGLLLDLTSLHLSHRMIPEAQSFLDAVPEISVLTDAEPLQIRPRDIGRRAGLSAAVLGLRDDPETAPPDWADAALFDALHHIAQGQPELARPLLGRAETILDGYPPAFSDLALPQLLSAAIETESWNMAQSFASRLEQEVGGKPRADYLYLLGRAAEAGGNHVAAFDNYAAAAAKSDAWAHRARLALIDLGLATRTLPNEDARLLLLQARRLWSGGALGLVTLQQLASLDLATDHDISALDVLAEIVRLYPETPEAGTALAQADALIEKIYRSGLAGDMSLSDLVASHRAISRDYQVRPVYDVFAEPYADYLLANSASALAAAEYGAIRSQIEARDTSGAIDPEETDRIASEHVLARDRLRLKHATALMQGQSWADAEDLLDVAVSALDDDLRDNHQLLRAKLFAATERPAEVLGTRMETPTADYLRMRAEAAFALSHWAEAQEAYELLLRRLGPDLQTRDRINLLLSAHRSGDLDRVRDLTRDFPSLGDDLAALATEMTATLPEVLPLRDDTARQRVANADNALRQLRTAEEGADP